MKNLQNIPYISSMHEK